MTYHYKKGMIELSDKINISDSKQYRIEYLNMIQGVINRMDGNSALMKGFAATIIAAIFGLAVSGEAKWYYLLAAVLPMIGFIRLDIYYLQMERRYRNLYALIAENQIESPHFALDLRSQVFIPHKEAIRKNSGFWRTLVSISVWRFYLWLVFAAGALIAFVA